MSGVQAQSADLVAMPRGQCRETQRRLADCFNKTHHNNVFSSLVEYPCLGPLRLSVRVQKRAVVLRDIIPGYMSFHIIQVFSQACRANICNIIHAMHLVPHLTLPRAFSPCWYTVSSSSILPTLDLILQSKK